MLGPGNPPEEINVVVEIPSGSGVKFEMDKETGKIFVDRFLHTSMVYPFNYGFVPGTKAEDGDPVDVLVISNSPVPPGCVIKCRPIGILNMEDEEGEDTKVIAVPVSKLDPTFDGIKNVSDLPDALKEKIRHFFEHYKDLEKGKWVKVRDWEGSDKAKEIIEKSVVG
ncbi:MAG: inorganic diphosphatase [Candidatus Micrarchaeota archaeon]|nr:inorganic diphosphatase [Candidatus Micrarchaeota archaeon]